MVHVLSYCNDNTSEVLLKTGQNDISSFLQPSEKLHLAALKTAKELVDPFIKKYLPFFEVATADLDDEQIIARLHILQNGILKYFSKNYRSFINPSSDDENEIDEHIKAKEKTRENSLSNEYEDESEASLFSQNYLHESNEDNHSCSENSEVSSLEGTEDANSEETNQHYDSNEEVNLENNEEDYSENSEEYNFHNNQEKLQPDKINASSIIKDAFGLNDPFFNLDNFNRDTRMIEENEELNSNEDDVDYFGDPDEQDVSEEESNKDASILKYKEFFDPPSNLSKPSKRMRIELEDETLTQKDTDLGRCKIESIEIYLKNLMEIVVMTILIKKIYFLKIKNGKLPKEIANLEKESVQEKAWMLKGEINSKARPINSLLEIQDEIEVDRNLQPMPIITEATSKSLEGLIKQRIVDNQFDEVVRRLPNEILNLKSELAVLSATKNKDSLAQIYEKEAYVEANHKISNPTLDKQHADIDYLMDSLSNWNYTPRPLRDEVTIVSNIPSEKIEEARPDATVEDISRLAPQELYKTRKGENEIVRGGVIVSIDEMTERKQRRNRRKRHSKHYVAPSKPQNSIQHEKAQVLDQLQRGNVKVILKNQQGQVDTNHYNKNHVSIPTSNSLKL